jgi:UDP-3-O-[3-hydroxymyristoyl] glucosamine N-acyltransferase
MEMTLKEVAGKIGGEVIGDASITVKTITGLEKAEEGALVWIEKRRFLKAAEATEAAAVIVPPDIEASTKPLVRVKNPRLAFARLAQIFFPPRRYAPGIAETAVVSPDARIGEGVSVQPRAVIEEGVVIGDRAVIGAGAFVGMNSRIGADTRLFPHAVVNDNNVVGERCIIHSGAVIGGDGFGYVPDGEGRNVKIPQVGRVVVEDDVEIGCNTTIDRGTFGDTLIRRGVKIDNLVQIAHNDEIGENTVLCAQVGISGSVKIGRNVILAGQVGIADHVEIGDRVMMAGKSGLAAKKKVGPDQILLGAPARPLREAKKLHAWESRIAKKLMAGEDVDSEV